MERGVTSAVATAILVLLVVSILLIAVTENGRTLVQRILGVNPLDLIPASNFTPYAINIQEPAYDSARAMACAARLANAGSLDYAAHCPESTTVNLDGCQGVQYSTVCVTCSSSQDSLTGVRCSVRGFHLPDPVESRDDAPGFLRTYGDPRWLLYYQQFPNGEDTYWQENVYHFSFGSLWLAGGVNFVLGGGGGTIAREALKPVQEGVKKGAVDAMKAALKQSVDQSIVLSLSRYGTKRLLDVLKRAYAVFRATPEQTAKKKLLYDTLLREGLVLEEGPLKEAVLSRAGDITEQLAKSMAKDGFVDVSEAEIKAVLASAGRKVPPETLAPLLDKAVSQTASGVYTAPEVKQHLVRVLAAFGDDADALRKAAQSPRFYEDVVQKTGLAETLTAREATARAVTDPGAHKKLVQEVFETAAKNIDETEQALTKNLDDFGAELAKKMADIGPLRGKELLAYAKKVEALDTYFAQFLSKEGRVVAGQFDAVLEKDVRLFIEGLEKLPPSAREAYLKQAMEGVEGLRPRDVDSFLEATGKALASSQKPEQTIGILERFGALITSSAGGVAKLGKLGVYLSTTPIRPVISGVGTIGRGAMAVGRQHKVIGLIILSARATFFAHAQEKWLPPPQRNAMLLVQPVFGGSISPPPFDLSGIPYMTLVRDGGQPPKRFHLVSPCKADFTVAVTQRTCDLPKNLRDVSLLTVDGKRMLVRSSSLVFTPPDPTKPTEKIDWRAVTTKLRTDAFTEGTWYSRADLGLPPTGITVYYKRGKGGELLSVDFTNTVRSYDSVDDVWRVLSSVEEQSFFHGVLQALLKGDRQGWQSWKDVGGLIGYEYYSTNKDVRGRPLLYSRRNEQGTLVYYDVLTGNHPLSNTEVQKILKSPPTTKTSTPVEYDLPPEIRDYVNALSGFDSHFQEAFTPSKEFGQQAKDNYDYWVKSRWTDYDNGMRAYETCTETGSLSECRRGLELFQRTVDLIVNDEAQAQARIVATQNRAKELCRTIIRLTGKTTCVEVLSPDAREARTLQQEFQALQFFLAEPNNNPVYSRGFGSLVPVITPDVLSLLEGAELRLVDIKKQLGELDLSRLDTARERCLVQVRATVGGAAPDRQACDAFMQEFDARFVSATSVFGFVNVSGFDVVHPDLKWGKYHHLVGMLKSWAQEVVAAQEFYDAPLAVQRSLEEYRAKLTEADVLKTRCFNTNDLGFCKEALKIYQAISRDRYDMVKRNGIPVEQAFDLATTAEESLMDIFSLGDAAETLLDLAGLPRNACSNPDVLRAHDSVNGDPFFCIVSHLSKSPYFTPVWRTLNWENELALIKFDAFFGFLSPEAVETIQQQVKSQKTHGLVKEYWSPDEAALYLHVESIRCQEAANYMKRIPFFRESYLFHAGDTTFEKLTSLWSTSYMARCQRGDNALYPEFLQRRKIYSFGTALPIMSQKTDRGDFADYHTFDTAVLPTVFLLEADTTYDDDTYEELLHKKAYYETLAQATTNAKITAKIPNYIDEWEKINHVLDTKWARNIDLDRAVKECHEMTPDQIFFKPNVLKIPSVTVQPEFQNSNWLESGGIFKRYGDLAGKNYCFSEPHAWWAKHAWWLLLAEDVVVDTTLHATITAGVGAYTGPFIGNFAARTVLAAKGIGEEALRQYLEQRINWPGADSFH